MLQTTTASTISGLSDIKAKELLIHYGYNEIPEKHATLFGKIVKNIISPIAIMLLLAAGLSFVLGKTFDGYFILILIIINISITLWQEKKADNAIQKLNEHLSQHIKTLRDSTWTLLPSRMLVPDDVIELHQGDVVPADGTIMSATHVSVNESSLTGESLPKDKKEGESVFSGSFLTTGIATIQVSATGSNTNFGKTIFSVETLRKKSALEKDILSISKFLTLLSIVSLLLLSIVFILQKASILELLTLDLSLLIAGIPISLPTVMTLIIEFGVLALAAKHAIVRRLSALEDLANVDFLLTDKTGTLTKNKIAVQDVYAYDGFTHEDVLSFASLVASQEPDNPINSAVLGKAKGMKEHTYTKNNFIPADSTRKRSTFTITRGGKMITISLGAPQIIQSLCTLQKTVKEKFDREVETLAHAGYRTLAVSLATGEKETHMQIVGLIALSDTLRDDAKSVIEFLLKHTIDVAMVTGDNRQIARQIATQLSLHNGIVIAKEQLDKTWDSMTKEVFQTTAAFAEILPEDKLHLVQKAKQFFTVAANGDGINDLPAIKAATVGIAVKNAVSALKETADIILLTSGISVIRDAIIESRKIFARLYTYSLYRISESLRMIVTIAILGILYRIYPLTPLQIIVVALLNDIPIISLATDRVKVPNRPAKINAKKRFTLSSLYGLVGIANSLIMFFVIRNLLHLDWGVIQTMYFLKMTVSGHMLIYVAHTKERWWRFLPSNGVMLATTLTQLAATLLAITGFLMPSHISFLAVIFVWVWSFFWMQVGEAVKILQEKFAL